MSKKMFVFVAFIVISSMVLSACGPAAAPVVSQNVEISIDNAPEVEESSTADEPKNNPPPTEEPKNDPPPAPSYPDVSHIGRIEFTNYTYRKVSKCPNSVLRPGDHVVVSLDSGRNALRKDPDNSKSNNIIDKYDPGTSMSIQDENPVCSHGIIMWYVSVEDGKKGWTAETDGGELWLTPIVLYDRAMIELGFGDTNSQKAYDLVVGILLNEVLSKNQKREMLYDVMVRYDYLTLIEVFGLVPTYTENYGLETLDDITAGAASDPNKAAPGSPYATDVIAAIVDITWGGYSSGDELNQKFGWK